MMGGQQKTFTHDVTTRDPLFPFSRLKTETASEGTPQLSGYLKVAMLMTVLQYCLTYLNAVTTHTIKHLIRL